MKALVLISVIVLSSVAELPAQQQSPPGQQASGVDSRGDHAMGFSHQTAAHHFILLANGGAISVETSRDHDDATRDQIRMHLSHIATLFSSGDFDIPMFIHDRVPPGVLVMKAKRDAITYTYQETERGGKVRIKTTDPDALNAVHEFLLFQIQDHRTGDKTVVSD